MRKFKKGLIVLFVMTGITAFAKNTNKQVTTKQSIDETKEASLVFKAGKVIEVAFASIKGGEEENLNTKYFSKIMPIAAKYGGKILGSFEVHAITGGEIKPQTIVIFEWTSIEARDRLLADKEAQKLFPIRDKMLTSARLAYYSVKKDTKVTFRENKVYEFFNAWLTVDSEKELPKYFKGSDAPKKRYGSPKFLVNLNPIKSAYENLDEPYLHPHMAGIVEWDKTADFYGLISDAEWIKASKHLNKSVSRLDMIHAKFNFPR